MPAVGQVRLMDQVTVLHVGVRRSSARCAEHGQNWCGFSLAVPRRDYPVRQAD